jgi:bidirectional [NiFe] hydrogenase diaphorase subunit
MLHGRDKLGDLSNLKAEIHTAAGNKRFGTAFALVRRIREGRPLTPVTSPTSAHPSGDKRFKILDAALRKHQFRPDSLIEVLHKAQELFGYLEEDVLHYVARALWLPPSRVYGVATFYHLFTLKPRGEHTCVVCLGTACFVKGADGLLAAAEKRAGVKSGQTTPDNRVSLLTARCIGACGIAPAVVYDGATSGQQTLEAILQHLDGWLRDGPK